MVGVVSVRFGSVQQVREGQGQFVAVGLFSGRSSLVLEFCHDASGSLLMASAIKSRRFLRQSPTGASAGWAFGQVTWVRVLCFGGLSGLSVQGCRASSALVRKGFRSIRSGLAIWASLIRSVFLPNLVFRVQQVFLAPGFGRSGVFVSPVRLKARLFGD